MADLTKMRKTFLTKDKKRFTARSADFLEEPRKRPAEEERKALVLSAIFFAGIRSSLLFLPINQLTYIGKGINGRSAIYIFIFHHLELL
jgi:hypothetical protein